MLKVCQKGQRTCRIQTLQRGVRLGDFLLPWLGIVGVHM